MRQIAALPYRIEDDGSARIMLITSRGTGRWVVPKGNPIKGLDSHAAAAHEAYEEAGIRGTACPTPIGRFRYVKRLKDGRERNARVEVFPIAFVAQASEWPEQDERRTRWFTLPDAAAAVDEPELSAIIAGFRAPEPRAGLPERALLWVRRHSNEKVPMLRWFQSLMPKQGRFFELFEAHVATLVAGADSLARLLEGGDGIAAHCREIVAREQEADDITREVLLDVRRTFITPFDRSAITDLIGSMDDAIDQMNHTAKAITLFEVGEFPQAMRDMSGIVVEAARVTQEAIPLLRSVGANGARLHELTERIVRIEGHADEIYDAGLKALFHEARAGETMHFIVHREIYQHLEKIVDRFEDVANEIQGLVIDHA